MKVYFAKFRRIFLSRSIFIAVLMLTVGLCLGIKAQDYYPTFADAQITPSSLQNVPTLTRVGQRKIALEVAEKSLAEEFGIFNLFIIFFVTLVVALRLVLIQYTPNKTEIPPPDPPEKHLAITPLAFPTILPPFGIAIALTLMIVAAELGLNTWVVIVLLLVVMGLNLLSMLAAEPICKFIRPVILKILGFTLGVMQFALGIQFILTGLEIQALVLQILLQGK